MALSAFFVVAIALFATAQAEGETFNADEVKPFAQPEPLTISDKAAVTFKPQLKISGACHPYPAVASNGYVTAGLESSWPILSGCGGSDLGSQIYSRSKWHRDVWAIMYTWYFPKGVFGGFDYTHDWAYAIVWIDNPALETPAIVGATVKTARLTEKYAPVDAANLDGTSLKCKYKYQFWKGDTTLQATEDSGGFQDLITWDQLPEISKTALNKFPKIPLSDDAFEQYLADGWPF